MSQTPVTPSPELDLSWLDQLGLGDEKPAEPIADLPVQEAPVETPADHNEAPTMLIPEVPVEKPVESDEAPTMLIPPVEQKTPQVQPKVSKPAPKAPAKKKASPKIGLILGIISGALVLALVIGVLIYGVVLKNGDTIYPNVYVAGINVGGMTRQRAIAAVDEAIAASYASATLKVQLPDRTISFSPEQTNVALDADEAIEEALAYGRDGNPFSAVTNYFSCRTTEHYIDLQTILNLDTQYIRDLIEEVAAEVESDPIPSEVHYDEEKGRIMVTVGYPDRDLNADGLYEVVYNAFMNSDFTPLSWDYDEIPCELVDLEPYYEEYCTEVQDAVYDEETHTIVDEIPGFGFNLEAANQKLATAAPGSEVVIQLEELEPETTRQELEDTMFGESLFAFSSPYVVNSNRTNNLTLACEAINGTILNPGEVFSFNNVVGERTAAKGYLPATVYSGGQSLEELGGGVCQVASTIYYCTLHLNMEQIERQPHQFAVTYVDFGMDATVYWGHIDYQFRNTLSNPVMILANTENGHVNISFMGVPDTDNYVKMSYVILETYPWQEVKEVDETLPVGHSEVKVTPYTGYKVVTYKAIYDAAGNELSKTQEAISVYDKRDKTILVGPEEGGGLDPDNPFDPETPVDPEDPDDPEVGLDPDNSFDPENPDYGDGEGGTGEETGGEETIWP